MMLRSIYWVPPLYQLYTVYSKDSIQYTAVGGNPLEVIFFIHPNQTPFQRHHTITCNSYMLSLTSSSSIQLPAVQQLVKNPTRPFVSIYASHWWPFFTWWKHRQSLFSHHSLICGSETGSWSHFHFESCGP